MAENQNEEINTSAAAQDSQNEEDDSAILTLNDVMELEEEMIQDAAAVLGASNDKTCSYHEGYMKRQALYSCLTCIPEARSDPGKGAGMCLACSFQCHDGHDLVELYTKRKFRCDCGNSRFNGTKCNLCEDKDPVNELNKYNQNFCGLYCTCHRPYPDPEDPTPDEMIQCIMCEDWFHSRHLDMDVPSGHYAEMVCKGCVEKHDFLLHYPRGVDVEAHGDEEENTTKKCSKPEIKSQVTAKFFQDISWRNELCHCDDCLKIYKDEDVEFLIDSEDSVHLYEEKGKAKAMEVADSHNQTFMNSLDRVQLVEAIAGYNDLKENLTEYLKKFAENKKVVRLEDVKEFFEGMKARKRQKVSVPHYCH